MLMRRQDDAVLRALTHQLNSLRRIATTACRPHDEAPGSTAAKPPVDGKAELLRRRNYGNPPLPISPLLVGDKPRANRKPKASREQQKPEDLTEFQQALALNPYALALASPVRHCTLTSAKLPKHFLLPFSTSLIPPSGSPSEKSKASLQSGHHSSLSDALPATSYVLNDASVIAHLSKKSHWRTLVTERMKQHFAPTVQKNAKTINVKDFWSWNADATQIRERLERDVLNAVMEATEYESGRLVSDGDVEAACVILPCDFRGFAGNVADFMGAGAMTHRLPGPPAGTTASDIPMSRRLDLEKAIGLLKHDLTTKVQLAFDRLAAHTT
nr:hypothetical protein B0A51_14974 [Rachicladosporium sp. CCFEE 5018]